MTHPLILSDVPICWVSLSPWHNMRAENPGKTHGTQWEATIMTGNNDSFWLAGTVELQPNLANHNCRKCHLQQVVWTRWWLVSRVSTVSLANSNCGQFKRPTNQRWCSLMEHTGFTLVLLLFATSVVQQWTKSPNIARRRPSWRLPQRWSLFGLSKGLTPSCLFSASLACTLCMVICTTWPTSSTAMLPRMSGKLRIILLARKSKSETWSC